MTSLQVMNLLERNYDVNHILASSIVDKIDLSLFDDNNVESIFLWYQENKPKPFVKWVGGKRQLINQFKSMNLYPSRNFNPLKSRYFEPFVGGGAIFFDLLPQKAILSDLNRELVITYNVIKDNPEELIKSLKKYKHNKDYFLKIRKRDPETLSDVERSSRFIYLNKTCFNGMYRVNLAGRFNVPFGDQKNPLICDQDNILKVSSVLKNTKIIEQDYKKVLKDAKKGDFIYFDPPYYPVNRTSNFTSYTANGFFEKEQEELRDVYVKLHKRGCFVMLSNSNTSFINKLYSNLGSNIKLYKVNAKRMINSDASKRGKIKEVLVVNY